MDKDILYLKELAAQKGIELSETQLLQFETYSLMLREWNEKMNLTAIKEPREIAVKHFYDSLLFLANCDIPKGARVIDVGTGAGFPGVVLKIARPDIDLTLLDSLNKRLIFLGELLKALNLTATLVHSRAEESAKPPMRESFDIATARAVAALPALCEYCIPYVKVGGSFVAMKGPSVKEEAEAAAKAVKLLGGSEFTVLTEHLPEGDERCFAVAKKVSQTPTKYPRNSAKITKSPL